MLYVDCDSHILPEDAFDEVAPEFRARGPRLVADEKGVRVVYEARQKNIPDYARHIPNPFNPRPRVSRRRSRAVACRHGECQVRYAGVGAQQWSFLLRRRSGNSALSVCRSYNNSLGRIVKKYPGKFFGLVTLPIASSRTGGGRA